MVLTATHVVARRAVLINPRVVIAGQSLSAKVLKQGSFEDIDLALLSVDQIQIPLKLRLRRDVVLCSMPRELARMSSSPIRSTSHARKSFLQALLVFSHTEPGSRHF